jgi:hypothetical protein
VCACNEPIDESIERTHSKDEIQKEGEKEKKENERRKYEVRGEKKVNKKGGKCSRNKKEIRKIKGQRPEKNTNAPPSECVYDESRLFCPNRKKYATYGRLMEGNKTKKTRGKAKTRWKGRQSRKWHSPLHLVIDVFLIGYFYR